MFTWNFVYGDEADQIYLLSGVRITCSPKAKPDITWLMSRMEELNVPPAYLAELEEIRFTRLRNRDHGDYFAGRIRLSVSKESWPNVDRTLIHELAHHVDDLDEITLDDRLDAERKRNGHHMPDQYARRNVGEYLAVGFEVYYLGTKEEKSRMRKMNPLLFRTIRNIHRRYQKR